MVISNHVVHKTVTYEHGKRKLRKESRHQKEFSVREGMFLFSAEKVADERVGFDEFRFPMGESVLQTVSTPPQFQVGASVFDQPKNKINIWTAENMIAEDLPS